MSNYCPGRPRYVAATEEEEGKIEELIDTREPEVNAQPPNHETTPDQAPVLEKINSISQPPLFENKPAEGGEKVFISACNNDHASHLVIPVTISTQGKEYKTHAMIDSGATGNFVNSSFRGMFCCL